MKFSNRKTDDYGSLVFPTVIRVAAKTIAADLVAVKSMAMPKMQINYMDYTYETEEQKQARLALERSEARKTILDEITKDLNEKGLN